MARGYNRAILVGNVASEPSPYRHRNGDLSIRFRLAVNGPRGQEPLFVDVVAWTVTAERALAFVRLGALLLVDGRLVIRTYRKGKVEHTVSEIVCDSIELVAGAGAEARRFGASVQEFR